MSIFSDRYAGTIHVPGYPESSVSTYYLTPEQSGAMVTTSGNLGNCVVYLPKAQAGLHYFFQHGTSSTGSHQAGFEAQSGDIIRWPFNGTGFQGMYSTVYKNAMQVRAINNTDWYTLQNYGGWTGY